MADPFTEVHDAIWSTLEASTAFTALVPVANRIRLTSKRGQMDGTPKQALKPLVRVRPANGQSRVMCSSGTELKHVWAVQISIGDERVTPEFFPVMWAVYRAMAAASKPSSTVRSVTWNSKTFVRTCELTSFEEQYLNEKNEPVKGWQTLWAYEVYMDFTTSDLPPS